MEIKKLILLLLLIGLHIHKSTQNTLGGAQSGKFFTVGGAAGKSAQGVTFSNIGNVGTSGFNTGSGFGSVLNKAVDSGLALQGFSGGYGSALNYPGFASLGVGFGATSPALFGLTGFPGASGLSGISIPPLGPAINGPQRVSGPSKLTCRNVQVLNGHREAALAVTIADTSQDRVAAHAFGFLDAVGPEASALSIDLSLRIEGATGAAKVIFTTRAAVSQGCDIKNLGDVFTGHREDAFGLLGTPFFGGYPTGEEEGIVTTLSLYPDRQSTVHKDKLDIQQLADLAGRGVAVVKTIQQQTTDVYGQGAGPASGIQGEVLACCALAYDDQFRSLDQAAGADHELTPPGYSSQPVAPPVYPPVRPPNDDNVGSGPYGDTSWSRDVKPPNNGDVGSRPYGDTLESRNVKPHNDGDVGSRPYDDTSGSRDVKPTVNERPSPPRNPPPPPPLKKTASRLAPFAPSRGRDSPRENQSY